MRRVKKRAYVKVLRNVIAVSFVHSKSRDFIFEKRYSKLKVLRFLKELQLVFSIYICEEAAPPKWS